MKTLKIIFGTLFLTLTIGLMTSYAGSSEAKADKNVVEIAVADKQFSILVEAVVKADLVSALSAEGPFTVFAPTNAAFESLFEELGVNGVADLNKDQLTSILLYHVVDGAVYAKDISSGKVSTLNKNAQVDVTAKKGKVMVDKSNVVAADIQGTNGVIHVIDKVLVPKVKTMPSSGGGC